jgi:RNA polymerase sigma-70 factor (ECF subfamily)
MPDDADFAALADPYRRELLVHCYRMLGSFHDAEDAVQEVYLRAWRGLDGFEGRSSVRTWLYRIATRVCLTALEKRERRVLPSGLGGPTEDVNTIPLERRPEVPWLEPFPDRAVFDDPADPAVAVAHRESVRLAFVAALQTLPARQRAALLLCDVVRLSARDAATALEMTTAAVNSALQRARAQLAAERPVEGEVAMTAEESRTLAAYISAFEGGDVAALADLLRQDVALEMPPVPGWFAGRPAVLEFIGGRVMAPTNRWRLIPVRANGCPAAISYRRGDDGRDHMHGVQVLEMIDGRIAHLYVFLDALHDERLLRGFDVPTVL